MKEYANVSRSAAGGMVVRVSIVDGTRSVRWSQKTMRGHIKADRAAARAYCHEMLAELEESDE